MARRGRHAGLRHAGALVALAALVGAAACADATTSDGADAGGGASSGAAAPALCPEAVPEDGRGCALPEGTTCAFGACATHFARCARGVWRLSANAPAPPVCPSQPPAAGEPCPPCWPVATSCLYGSTDCTAPDASVTRAVATCASGAWALAFEPCRDGGGADVQRDGGADAD